jgi:uncharacterized protein (TIGR02246 family)
MDANEAVFRALLDAFHRGDHDAAAGYFAPDGVVVDQTGATVVYEGREAIAELIRGFAGMLPGLAIEIVDLVAKDDRLAAELVARGTPEGQTEAVELRYCVFDTFRDGEILSEHLYVDSARLPAEV